METILLLTCFLIDEGFNAGANDDCQFWNNPVRSFAVLEIIEQLCQNLLQLLQLTKVISISMLQNDQTTGVL